MATASRSNLNTFPDSPYAAELQAGTRLRFSLQLEAEYTCSYLLRSRTIIRAACVLGLILAIFRSVEHSVNGDWNSLLLFDFVWVISGSSLLVWLSWSRSFEQRYLQWAQIIVPLRSALAAFHIAEAAARGQLEMLMIMTAVLLGPFFFLGLRFRAALCSGVLAVGSFTAAAVIFELAQPVALRCSAFLILVLVACAFAALTAEKSSRTAFLESHLVAELAQHDALTGVKNRRMFDEHLARVWSQATRDSRMLAILLIDVDHFKAYNDRYGHQAGDQALRRVAQTVQTFVRRPLDIVARYGGEEFTVILYDTGAEQAKAVAERMRRAVEELAIEHRGSRTSPRVTISIGVAVIEPTMDRDSRGALQLADQALYEAKVCGRNRVELMNDAEYRMLVTGVFSKKATGVPR